MLRSDGGSSVSSSVFAAAFVGSDAQADHQHAIEAARGLRGVRSMRNPMPTSTARSKSSSHFSLVGHHDLPSASWLQLFVLPAPPDQVRRSTATAPDCRTRAPVASSPFVADEDKPIRQDGRFAAPATTHLCFVVFDRRRRTHEGGARRDRRRAFVTPAGSGVGEIRRFVGVDNFLARGRADCCSERGGGAASVCAASPSASHAARQKAADAVFSAALSGVSVR